MLRVNVATRPFYNERGVHLLLALVGLALLGLAVFNAWSLVRLSQREGVLGTTISQQEARARQLRQEAGRLRGTVRQDDLEAVLAAAREANGLIDRRTFSWTSLFNYLEATLPDDVMLTAVRPAIDENRFIVTMVVVGREVDAIDEFMERLEETGAFKDLLSREERARDDGTVQATLIGAYVPDAAQPPPQASAARPSGGEAVP